MLFEVLTDGILLEPQNITNLVVQNCYILILAIGMVMVIIAGHIDLSVGLGRRLHRRDRRRHDRALGLALVGRPSRPASLVGALVGAWQGYWIAYVGIPAFIVTLAGMLIFRGLTLIMLENQQIAPVPRGAPRPRQRLPARTSPAGPRCWNGSP